MSVPQPKITVLPSLPLARVRALDEVMPSSGATSSRLATWLALVCNMIPAVAVARVSIGAHAERGFDSSATWPPGMVTESDISALAERARVGAEPLVMAQATTPGSVMLARKMTHSSHADAVLVLKLPQPGDGQRETLFKLLDWSAAWLQLVLAGDNGHLGAARLELLSAALSAPALREAATAMAIRVALIAGADHSSIGLVRSDRIELLARSHSASFDPGASGSRALVAAMEEAVDEGCALATPALVADAAVFSLAHDQLRAHESAVAVCTLPLRDGSITVGALSLCRHRGAPFTSAEIAGLGAMTADIACLLRHKRDAEASLGERLAVRLANLGGVHHQAVRWALGAAVLLVAALACIDGTYRVAAPATLRGSIQRSIVAPIDGYVLEAPARAGDVVKQGDVLALLDTQSLDFERRKWLAERSEADKTLRQAVAKLDRAEAAISKARLGKAAAQLALVEGQIARARLIAPFDGMVIAGDLSRAMGAPVNRGEVLFEIAPLDDYRVELEVGEGDVAAIRAGQHGALALAAWSAAPLPFIIDRVLGVAQTSDGRNVFKVEAVLSGEVSQLRPGMQGVGRIETGQRRLLWVWTHALIDRVGLWWWWRVP